MSCNYFYNPRGGDRVCCVQLKGIRRCQDLTDDGVGYCKRNYKLSGKGKEVHADGGEERATSDHITYNKAYMSRTHIVLSPVSHHLCLGSFNFLVIVVAI